MKSRVHPKYKTKYRVANWPEYDRALARRGDITLWISEEALESRSPPPGGKRGGQCRYSDAAIETALTLRLIFHLPLRQTEGFLRSLMSPMGLDLDVPDHPTISRRSRRRDVTLNCTRIKEPVHLVVDSRGLSIVGEGEWAAVKHCRKGKRGWKKECG